MDRSKVSHIEAEDERGGVSLPTLRALCLALHLSADRLLQLPDDLAR